MDMKKMMKEARKMQAELNKAQEEVGLLTATATAGGGAVTVVANGNQVVESVKIDPAAVDPEDVEMLEDLVLTAVNDALRNVGELASARLDSVTGGIGNLGIPGF
jgi:DNA-binding YbaB/EbfC family protein